MRDTQAFDEQHQTALKRIWFLGDVHGDFTHIAKTLLATTVKPSWMVFLGDIDIDHKPFREVLEPLHRYLPDLKISYIFGNHDSDSYDHWEMLHDCGNAIALHRQVMDMDGVKVGGLGGNFMGRVWNPPSNATYRNKEEAMKPGPYQWRDGQRPNPSLHAAIYPDDFEHLAKLRADILVTHEAPSCHPYGFPAIDELSRSMQVVRTFHGHHHDDRSDEYALLRNELQFDARAVSYCSIKNGLGEVIYAGPQGW